MQDVSLPSAFNPISRCACVSFFVVHAFPFLSPCMSRVFPYNIDFNCDPDLDPVSLSLSFSCSLSYNGMGWEWQLTGRKNLNPTKGERSIDRTGKRRDEMMIGDGCSVCSLFGIVYTFFRKADSIFPSLPWSLFEMGMVFVPHPSTYEGERGRKKRKRAGVACESIYPSTLTILFPSFPLWVCVLCNDEQIHRGSLYKEQKDGRATIEKTPYSEPVVDDPFFYLKKLPDGLAKKWRMIPKNRDKMGLTRKTEKCDIRAAWCL